MAQPGAYDDVEPMLLRGEELPTSYGSGAKVGALEMEQGREDDGDDLLLEWAEEQQRRWSVCGVDCSPLRRALRCHATGGPEWWRRLSGRQRGCLIATAVLAAVALLTLALVPATTRGVGDGGGVGDGSRADAADAAPPVSPSYEPEASAASPAPAPEPPLDLSASPLCKWGGLYLPEIAVPAGYTLNITSDMVGPEYAVTGAVAIQLRVRRPTPCVVLHVNGPNITDVRAVLEDEGGATRVLEGRVLFTSPELQQVVLAFDEALPSTAVLELAFSYKLEEGLDGFYLSPFLLDDDSRHVMGSTQFESIAARKAFPCFDEPAYKVPFQLHIEAPADLTVLSNMPVNATLPGSREGLSLRVFQRTPPMPTYLVAWVIGEEMATVNTTCATLGGNKTVAVWATKDRHDQLGTALRVACSALQTFESLLGVPYALPKLDLVGVPNFAAGAMENWGLLTYRETSLLVDEAAEDIQQEYYIALVVSHEIAHQWFGDLVTLHDWTELWLNEGFATLFENLAADAYHPSYHYMSRFYESVTAVGLEADASNTSHPLSIQRPIASLDEVDNWFDGVSYEKGGAVLRMMRAYINRRHPEFSEVAPRQRARRRSLLRAARHAGGAASPPSRRRRPLDAGPQRAPRDMFMRGLTSYLRDRAYGNATYRDMWDAVGIQSRVHATRMMSTWTLRRGYPIVSLVAEDDGAGNQLLSVQQVPYRPAPAFEVGVPYEPDQYCDDWTDNVQESSWWIPLSFTTSHNHTLREWLSFSNCTQALPSAVSNARWVLLNSGRYGFYRVTYPGHMWKQLAERAESPDLINGVDFAGLLDDAYALGRARHTRTTTFLQLASALGRRLEVEYSPWSIGLSGVTALHHLFATAALTDERWGRCVTALERYTTFNLTGPFIAGVKPPGASGAGLSFSVDVNHDSAELRQLRPLVLGAAGRLGYHKVAEQAARLVLAGSPLHADVRGAVLALAVGSGSSDAYGRVMQMYLEARNVVDKDRALRALQHATTPELVARTLLFALSPDVRLQDVGPLVAGVAAHGGASFQMAWEFTFSKVKHILERFPGGDATYSFGRRLAPLARLFTDPAMVPKLQEMQDAYPGVLPPTFMDAVHEAVRNNLDWLAAQGDDVCTWLAAAAG